MKCIVSNVVNVNQNQNQALTTIRSVDLQSVLTGGQKRISAAFKKYGQ